MNGKKDSVSNQNQSSVHPNASWWSLGVAAHIKVFIIGLLLYLLFRIEIDELVYSWLNNPSWSHGLLIPFFSLYFLSQKKKELIELKPQPSYLGLLLLLSCLIFYPLNIAHFNVAYFRPLTVIASLFAVVLFIGGWRLIRYTWLPILFLIFAVPLPGRFYRSVTIPMRIFAADVASFILNMVPKLVAKAEGVVINVTYKGVKMEPGLDVAEACSGMRLLMAFVALGVAMAYLHYRPAWQRIILLLSTVPIAILCNVIRVTITGFIYILWDPRYAQGGYHDMLGLAMLPLAFIFYGILAWFMANLFVEDRGIEKDIIVRKVITE